MRPYIICHMLSSVDGKIDGAALRAVTANGEYEAIGTKLEGDAWVCGRTTMEQHFAEDKPFVSCRTDLPDRSRSMSRAARSHMRSRSTQPAGFVGPAPIWMAITLFVL